MKKFYHLDYRCDCGKRYVLRNGKYGYFWGCEGYPKCTNSLSLMKAEICPECRVNSLIKRYDGKGNYRIECCRCEQIYSDWMEVPEPRYVEREYSKGSTYGKSGWTDEDWHEFADFCGMGF